jgi:hypothetical protein
MAKTKRVRWQCPEGKHAGELGSTRPPADATVRYCLECSRETGRLVKRVAPALEAKRDRRKEVLIERAKVRSARKREDERRKHVIQVVEADGMMGEVDVVATMRKMRRLPELRNLKPGWEPSKEKITLRRRRQSWGDYSGHAKVDWGWAEAGEIVLTLREGAPRSTIEEVCLHELVHILLPRKTWHGRTFRSTLLRAAREWWPGQIDEVRNEGDVYDMDVRIQRAARA